MGRRWVVLADGRRVLGYRKTLRQNIRTASDIKTEYRVIFQLPEAVAWSVREGEHGSVTVGEHGQCTARSYDSGLVVALAAKFIGQWCQPGTHITGVRQGSHGGNVTVTFSATQVGVTVAIGRGRPKLHAMRKDVG